VILVVRQCLKRTTPAFWPVGSGHLEHLGEGVERMAVANGCTESQPATVELSEYVFGDFLTGQAENHRPRHEADDAQTRESHRRIGMAFKASGTTVTVLGVDPIHAAALIGYSGGAYLASPTRTRMPPTTARLRSSFRLVAASCIGSHDAAIADSTASWTWPNQIRNLNTEGRIYFERRVAQGKTKKEALRVLKRQASDVVYRLLLA